MSMDVKETKKLDQNKLYIIIASVAIVLILIAVLAFSKSKNGNTQNGAQNGGTPQTTQLSIVNEQGNFESTIEANLEPVRNIKLGTSLKKIQKMEKKQKDTDNGSITNAEDGSGYSYLTYNFIAGATIPQFFGGTVNATDQAANLMYVLKDKKLIEVRINFGASTPDNYDAIVATNTAKYGEPNLVRSYSNGTKTTFWRTKKVMLAAYSQYDANGSYSISIYYSKVD